MVVHYKKGKEYSLRVNVLETYSDIVKTILGKKLRLHLIFKDGTKEIVLVNGYDVCEERRKND